jgi:hypothetical protein
MSGVLDPFRFVVIAVGCMNQRQLQAIDYLREENRVLREQLGVACGSTTISVVDWLVGGEFQNRPGFREFLRF